MLTEIRSIADEVHSLSSDNMSSLPTSWPTFEAVFREHWPQVYALLYRLVGTADEAEDLALEVFLRLHRRPRRDGDPDENLGGWLTCVATRLGLNAIRARRRRRRHEDEAGRSLAMDPPAAADAAIEVERAETRTRVLRVLGTLRQREAQLLLLRYAGLSYQEISGVLQISSGSVGTLLARAERRFEERYRRMEDA